MKIELYIHVSIRKGNHDYLIIRILVYCEHGAPLSNIQTRHLLYN